MKPYRKEVKEPDRVPQDELEALMESARELSWRRFGKKITFYHPGMFNYNGRWGKFPAISITGGRCDLQCSHCRGKILEPMINAAKPEDLVRKCAKLKESGNLGVLITGGSLTSGRIPWLPFIPAIKEAKKRTGLFISVHSGIIDQNTAIQLKEAGVDQALIDIIGDDETLARICHISDGVRKVLQSLDALQLSGIPIIPHIIAGLDNGKLRGELNAIEMVKKFNPDLAVIVALMPLPGTPMGCVAPPDAYDIARIMAWARLELPDSQIALGCARERGNSLIDCLGVRCGVNRMAIPGEEAIREAGKHGLEICWEETCCSIPEEVGKL